ncbi:uncharacterized protein LOC135829409 [Sycon ciliatum]|uniref:uncharacterized protein LOC135829409 n=1 Tax=Sycon ciliatum TaxID=27933 RepID=UPI0031F68409
MASSYHQEALRKQRAVDRAYQARMRLEAQMREQSRLTSPALRPAAPVPTEEGEESDEDNIGQLATHSRHCDSERGTRTSSQNGSRQGSRTSSRTTTNSSSSSRSSHTGDRNGRSSSGSRNASRQGNGIRQSPVATLSPDALVERDLRKSELLLRDNNLVMGRVNPKEALLADY